jgi:hypothetical protein
MPFHPLLFSVRLGDHFQNLSKCQKICFCPFMMVAITLTFTLELITLPFRWAYHECTHIYSDRDESEWVY